MKEVSAAQEHYELGKLKGELGDFKASLHHLELSAQAYAELKDHRQFIKCLTLCLRIHAEMENHKGIEAVHERLKDYVGKAGIELNSTTYYTLAQISSYSGDQAKALELLEKALALALAQDSKEDMCFAIHGLAAVYWSMGRLEDALNEIYNLRVFFQVLEMPDLLVSSQIMNGYILTSLKRYDEALDVFWKSFETVKSRRNVYTYTTLLFALAYTYAESGDLDMARIYIRLAQQLTDAENFVFLARKINELNQRVAGKVEGDNFDLVFKSSTNAILEKKKGKVDFKNQFILLDLLKLFLKNPGEVYTKEALVKAIWKQEYDPAVHDNKIYVTIKRLRQLIEPDFDKPKYIYRAKNGYYLNRNARVSFEQ